MPAYWPRHQWRLANCDWMPVSHTSGQPSNPRRHPTSKASSQRSQAVFSTPCHGAQTPAQFSAHLSTGCECTASLIETPICTRRTTTHQFFWQQQHTCVTLGVSPMECGVSGQSHKTPHFHPRHRHPTPRVNLPRTAWVRLNRLRTGVGRFCSYLYQWRMASSAACECGAAEKNTPSTMLSSNVQSIDLLVDCTAWRLWTMRQSNSWSTPAPRFSAAKQWFEELIQKMKKKLYISPDVIYFLLKGLLPINYGRIPKNKSIPDIHLQQMNKVCLVNE